MQCTNYMCFALKNESKRDKKHLKEIFFPFCYFIRFRILLLNFTISIPNRKKVKWRMFVRDIQKKDLKK